MRRRAEVQKARSIMAKLKQSCQQTKQHQKQQQAIEPTATALATATQNLFKNHTEKTNNNNICQRQHHHYQQHSQHNSKKYITRTATTPLSQPSASESLAPTLNSRGPLRCSLAGILASNYNFRVDTVFRMITMLVVVTVVISENVVFAAQRDSFKPKDPNSLSNNNNANTISNGIGSSSTSSNGNGNAAGGGGDNSNANTNNINNGNTNANIVNSSYGGSSSATSTISAADNIHHSTLMTTLTTSKTTTTTTTRSSSNLQKSSSNSNSFASVGSSGVNRNTIEVTEDIRNGPYFDKAASKNVTALLGKTAYLNCRVKNFGNKTMMLQVSWVRHRDIHLLTVGGYTYTSDQRFRAIHQQQTEDWTLQIKYPQHRDSGIYECQVSTTPHMSHYIHLNVVEPSTEIIGAPDLYIESGSTINLTCVILNSPEPPAYIFWNHNSAIINYDSPRGGVSVVTNKGETTTSFLLIKSARPSDSGHYQCNPSNAKPKSVTVHVLNGEFPAAMQRAGPALHRMSQNQYLLVYLSMYLFTLAYARRYMQPVVAVITAATASTEGM